MPILIDRERVTLEGACAVEEALPLLEALQAEPQREICMARATHVHTAVLQVLMAAQAKITTPPEEAFLSRALEPLMRGA